MVERRAKLIKLDKTFVIIEYKDLNIVARTTKKVIKYKDTIYLQVGSTDVVDLFYETVLLSFDEKNTKIITEGPK